MRKKLTLLISILLVLCLASGAWAGLIGHWKLDEGSGTTARDSSGKNNNGSLMGGPQWIDGVLGKALSFDGVDDYVEVPHNAALIPATGKATVALWINAKRHTGPGGAQWQGILAKGTWDPRLYNLYTEASGVLHFSTGPGNATIGTLSTGGLPLNEWVHATVVADGGHFYYLNGEPAGVAGQGATVPAAGSAPLTIGQTGGGDFFLGMIDDVRLYDRALTAQQVKDLFGGNPPIFGKAENPSPADGAAGVTLALLQWTPGEVAVFEDVYLGTTSDLTVADRVAQQPATLKMYYHMPGLISGQTYYWRVDGIDADGNVYTGDVWSFTAAPIKAFAPSPSDGARYVMLDATLSWSPGSSAVSGELYFGTNRDDVVAGAAGVAKGTLFTPAFDPGILESDTTYYWRVDGIDGGGAVETGYLWSFRTLPEIPVADPNLVGWWKLDEVSGPVVVDWSGHGNHGAFRGAPQRVAGYDSGALTFNGATDYVEVPHSDTLVPTSGKATVAVWINAERHTGPGGGTWQGVFAKGGSPRLYSLYTQDGAILHFSTGPAGGYVGSNSTSQVPLNEWVHIAVAVDGKHLYYLNGEPAGEGGSGATVPTASSAPLTIGKTDESNFFLGMIDDVRLYNTALTQDQIKEVMRGDPLLAWDAQPSDGSIVDIQDAMSLAWQPGDTADQHDVYFGTDAAAVADAGTSTPEYKGRQAGTSYSLDGLVEFGGGPYFWRIDEVEAGAAAVHPGHVWSFTVADYLIVDEFETYTDDLDSRIFQTWIDGWGYTEPAPGNPGNGTGSTVGYTSPPFAERTTVHGGKQAMPLGYDNSVQPYYSETERTFDAPQDWTVYGLDTLSLQVYGYPEVNDVTVTETGGKMSLTGAGADIWNASDEFTYAYKSLNGDGTIIAKVAGIGTGSNTWAKGGVMIRDSLDGNAAHAMMVLTGGGGNGAAFQNRAATGLDMNANDATSNTTAVGVITPPYWVKLERFGDSFAGHVSPDGNSWSIVGTQEMVMTAPVYIGLCVTSHVAGTDRTFEFENIRTTGSVSGSWQGAVIATPRHNAPQEFYVAIQDSTNKIAMVKDATVVNSTDWIEVRISLSRFAGVNAARVKKIFIGVGDRDNPAPDGTGMLFIDDIRVIKD